LAIAGNGDKLAPMMIFKRQPGKTNEKKYKKENMLKTKRFLFVANKIPGLYYYFHNILIIFK
jgi:hypothetical protein